MQINRLHFNTIDSTNQWAKTYASTCDREQLHVIVADEQTAGKGRNNRLWLSPPQQNLYVTYLFFLKSDQKDLSNLAQLMAVVAANTLQQCNFAIQLKWPNDLWIDKKKVGGILADVFTLPNNMAAALGIGINVNMPQATLDALAIPATSLAIERGSPVCAEDILTALTDNFAIALAQFFEQGFTPFLLPYRQAIVHRRGQKISFHSHNQILSGTFLEIGIDGRLHLELENGKIKMLSTGEICNETVK